MKIFAAALLITCIIFAGIVGIDLDVGDLLAEHTEERTEEETRVFDDEGVLGESLRSLFGHPDIFHSFSINPRYTNPIRPIPTRPPKFSV